MGKHIKQKTSSQSRHYQKKDYCFKNPRAEVTVREFICTTDCAGVIPQHIDSIWAPAAATCSPFILIPKSGIFEVNPHFHTNAPVLLYT